jgi:hypothetical protein
MGRWRFQAESGDSLRFAVIEKLEVFLLEAIDWFTFLIADDNANQDDVYADFESGGRIASDHFGC